MNLFGFHEHIGNVNQIEMIKNTEKGQITWKKVAEKNL